MSFVKDKHSDNYMTNEADWIRIKDFIPTNKKIYAPFYGDGKQKEYFKNMGFDIIHEDTDFFNNNYKFDMIIDNPPFSKKKEILTKLKEIDKPFILICPSMLLSHKYFAELFKNNIQIIIPYKRINFKHIESSKNKYSPPFASFYFCYKMNLKKDITWLE